MRWRLAPESSWDLCAGDALAPGRRVVRRLGGGGAHEVFLVRAGGREAVAKLPRPCVVRELECLRRLRDEGAALDRLAHPSLPRRLDTVLGGPRPHLLLEYVAGPTLRAAMTAYHALPPALVAGVGAVVARALAHLARAGWVHLDVKPSNIVLGDAPRLLDFELARPLEDAAALSAPLGTWAYMPPEQRAAGWPGADHAPIGPPADVFALAVSLGEALLGEPLPRRAPHAGRVLPGAVGALLGEALAPASPDRPSAAELAAGLAPLAASRERLATAA